MQAAELLQGAISAAGKATALIRLVRAQPGLVAGLGILVALVLFWLIGSQFVDVSTARPLSAPSGLSPSARYPLGTDMQGRNLLATIISGTPLTLRVGFLAGAIGLALGMVLGFASGYLRGVVDSLVRMVVDILLTIPALAVLIMITASIKTVVSVDMMALVIASFSWMGPTRIIRSQVLTLRERAYVDVSKLSGMNDMEIMFREILPNMLPFLAASFVNAVIFAILASIGLEALGLGPQNQPTLGMTIYWSISYVAMVAGMWWWWLPPLVVIVVLFVGLYLMAVGLDSIANPRLRGSL